jgi:hypothetical protein
MYFGVKVLGLRVPNPQSMDDWGWEKRRSIFAEDQQI